MTDADLLQALRDCFDPVSKRNIVEARLVQSHALAFDTEAPGQGIRGVPSRYIAKLSILSPSSDDTLNAQLEAQIANRLAGLEAISGTEIKMLPPLFPMLR
ncbi:DUF59 domain-containing protein [Granulicella cerasi]|uniref:DUF59 domain-containing protein n=1 Tax=Granulicella cerasi TaxID=741063 RepID=A0ABW1ZCS8_9BACT|nr:DUF59 domain-containing protein [Granulicella cerasi]